MNYAAHALLQVLARMRQARAGLGNEAGQTLAEYSLIVTLVAVGVTVAALMFFSTAVAGAFDAVTVCFAGSC